MSSDRPEKLSWSSWNEYDRFKREVVQSSGNLRGQSVFGQSVGDSAGVGRGKLANSTGRSSARSGGAAKRLSEIALTDSV